MDLTLIAQYMTDVVALLMLLGLLTYENLLKQHLKKFLKYSVFLTIIIILAELGSLAVDNQRISLIFLNHLFNIIGFSLTPLIPLVLMEIFSKDILKTYKCIYIPSIFNALAVFISPWLGWIYDVNSANQYERGSLFVIFILVYIINILILIHIVWLNGQKRFFPIKWKIIGLSLFTIVGTSIQLFLPEVISSWHVVTLAIFLLFILLSDFENSFDGLTGLFNRRAFEKSTASLSYKKPYSLILIDINHFKKTNDTHGHDTGDLALKEISDVFKKSIGHKLNGYRIGGDEFSIILGTRDESKVIKCLNSIKFDLYERRKKNPVLPTISVGYSIHDGSKSLTFKQIYKVADKLMYEDKEAQRSDKSF
jgi:diguanylate cyclase (GGDEF)-like protein